MSKWRAMGLLTLLLVLGCVNGDPVAPIEVVAGPAVLHTLTTERGDSLRLYDDESYRAKAAGSAFWVVGRYWFWTTPTLVNRLCALPNAVAADQYRDCYVWETAPGVLNDPGSAFLRNGPALVWSRVR